MVPLKGDSPSAGHSYAVIVSKQSAGILLYRWRGDQLEVLLAHMGGPFWAKRKAGAWTIPKGLIDDGEDLLAAARREFEEELGTPPPKGPVIDLGEIRQGSGKRVRAWAIEGDFDPTALRSNTCEVEWPPRSGRILEVPEIDRAEWMRAETIGGRLIKGQSAFVERLVASLAG